MTNRKIVIPKHTKIRDTYTIDKFIGAGAFGEVYKIRHKYLGIQALKIFHPGSIIKEQEAELFNEAFILAKLTHKNIVRVYEANTFVFEKNRYCYIAMEFVPGGTLAEYIFTEVRLPIDLACKIQKDICCGLAQLHETEPPLVHRDVKPQNIMLYQKDDNIIAKVSDFGLAKHVDPVTRITEAAGTLAYLPPEGFWDYESSASDVFSSGIIFYIMLTGIAPFRMPEGYNSTKKNEIQKAIKNSRNKRPKPPSEYNQDIKSELDDIVLKSLEPKIENRYANASQFYNAIVQFQTHKS
ncbi:serine/threonine-protein kinase [Candidatus Omnitrophota bacterium]